MHSVFPKSKFNALRPAHITFLAALYLLGCDSTASEGARNQKIGESVVLSLQKYHATYTAYPATLAELVPKYLNVLPADTRYGKWSYRSVDLGEGFELVFTAKGEHYTLVYDSKDPEWIVDTK
jgi:hypothetical protein